MLRTWKQESEEEHPLEWARIHEAYQTAVEYAKTLETVFEEIPDIRVPEFSQLENTGIQNEEPQKNAERSRQLQQRLERLAVCRKPRNRHLKTR